MKSLRNKEQGFTLIEIVIVMAIAAGLILVVLLAVGGAQRSKRDTQRRNDGTAFAAALESYAANNQGNYPAASTSNPLPTTLFNRLDPSTGSIYNFTTTPDLVLTPGTIAYNTSFKCSGQLGIAITPAQNRQYAVVVGLEGGGSVCYDNQAQ